MGTDLDLLFNLSKSLKIHGVFFGGFLRFFHSSLKLVNLFDLSKFIFTNVFIAILRIFKTFFRVKSSPDENRGTDPDLLK